MPLLTKAVRGTADILPKDSFKWQYIEKTVRETARLFGFQEIRTPVFEHTELFQRSVGETTDVVQKEMYTFEDKGGRSVTLRPEGTAGAARALLEHGLYNEAMPQKLYYLTTCYRYEKPQAGRLREHRQFGVESYGAGTPQADAEVIALAGQLLRTLGIQGLRLEINSIGCPDCRKGYLEALKQYFAGHLERPDSLCETCLSRLDRNPMRILDCKSPVCSKIAENAPKTVDYLCDGCRAYMEGVKTHLTAAGLEYHINPKIVRGLDYYTGTVFEFVSGDIGAQSTVCGGGRYNGLTGELGGVSLPAMGFGMGLDRLLMVMEAQGVDFPEPPVCDIYVAALGEEAAIEATRLCVKLRGEGFAAETDLCGRSLKAQMKYADKLGAKNTLVIGEEELQTGQAVLKNMQTGQGVSVDFRTGLLDAIYEQNIGNAFLDLTESLEKFV